MNKFEFVNELISKIEGREWKSSILDVGCRDCSLKLYLSTSSKYEGIDLFQNDDSSVDHVFDVSNGLPFKNGSYDYVIALDLLEHLNDITPTLNEFCRVSNKGVIVILPNMAHIIFRLRFLFSGRLSGKYDLKYGYGKDRHRWLTTVEQSDAYIRAFSKDKKLSTEILHFNDSPKKRLLALVLKAFGFKPNVWAWNSLYIIHKSE